MNDAVFRAHHAVDVMVLSSVRKLLGSTRAGGIQDKGVEALAGAVAEGSELEISNGPESYRVTVIDGLVYIQSWSADDDLNMRNSATSIV